MKRWLPLGGLGFVLLATALAWAQVPTKSYVLLSGATSTTTGLVAHASGYTLATVQVVLPAGATPTFTLQFEQSLNDLHYTATLCGPVGSTSTTGVASVNTAGIWRCNIAGAPWFRTNLTDYSGPGSVSSFVVLTVGDVGTGFPPIVTTTEAGETSDIVSHVSSVTHIAGKVEQGGNWSLKVPHITSVTHVSGALMLRDQEGNLVTVDTGALDVSCSGCSAAAVVAVSHVSSVTHIAGTITPTGSLAVSQSGAWTIQAIHQAGVWNITHISSVTHVSGFIQIQHGSSSKRVSVSQDGELLVVNSGTIAHVSVAHIAGSSDEAGGTVLGVHIAGNVVDGLNSAIRTAPVTLVTITGTVGHISSATHVVAYRAAPLHVVANTGSANLTCHSTAAVHQTSSGDIIAHGAAGLRLFICGAILISQSSERISLVEGTGAACGTGTRGVIGGSSASMPVGANGGYVSVSPFPQYATAVAGNQLCLLKSGSGVVSGTVTYGARP